MSHTGIQRNPIARRIRKNSPPANMFNLFFFNHTLTTERFDLRKCGINIISPDIDEQAIRLIFNRHPTLSYLDKATARPTFRHKLYVVVRRVSLNFPAKEITVKLSSFLGFPRWNFNVYNWMVRHVNTLLSV